MSRILETDNFRAEYPHDRFVLWLMKRESAEAIAAILNEDAGPESIRTYVAVDNDYQLRGGF